MTKSPFKKHFNEMHKDYGKVHIIDLLQDGRERENKLTKEYYKLYYESELKAAEQLKFLHFDFHRLCKGQNFKALRMLIQQTQSHIDEYGHCMIMLSKEQILKSQKGVFRINCLDSIDRTNVAMA